MSQDTPAVTFERLTTLDADQPTLIEGLPGHGLVAAIAVEQITKQLRLDHHGNIVSEQFPSITSFQDGRVRELVRVYARDDPPVMTLQSDVALPEYSFDPLSQCVIEALADEFERAIFLVGAAAGTEEQIGEVAGIATDDTTEAQLRACGVDLSTGRGLLGGVTGALVSACHHAEVPAAVLVVKANPYLPDPAAARAVIENALEPLVGFDIDTTELEEQADQIKTQMEQLSQQYRQMQEARGPETDEPERLAMFQ